MCCHPQHSVEGRPISQQGSKVRTCKKREEKTLACLFYDSQGGRSARDEKPRKVPCACRLATAHWNAFKVSLRLPESHSPLWRCHRASGRHLKNLMIWQKHTHTTTHAHIVMLQLSPDLLFLNGWLPRVGGFQRDGKVKGESVTGLSMLRTHTHTGSSL